MTANCSLNKNLYWQFKYLFIIYMFIYISNSIFIKSRKPYVMVHNYMLYDEKRPVGFPAHHLMLSTGEGCSRLWLAWLPYPGATIETHSLPSHLIPVKIRSALLQNSVDSHNSHTPNSHIHPELWHLPN